MIGSVHKKKYRQDLDGKEIASVAFVSHNLRIFSEQKVPVLLCDFKEVTRDLSAN